METITKRFYQEPDGRWYIDLPEFITNGHGTKASLEMIAGADLLLTQLADGKPEIYIRFNQEHFDGHTIRLVRSSDYGYSEYLDPEDDPGAWYHFSDNEKRHVWLCPVTCYVFNGIYPKNIFIQPIIF